MDDQLQQLALAYNTTIHISTGFTHFFLTHAREAKFPIDVMHGPPPDQPQSHSEFARDTVDSIVKAFTTAGETLGQSKRRQKENYDAHVHHKPYTPGGHDWLHNPSSHRHKFAPRWMGPYIVKKRLESNGCPGVTYRIQKGNSRRRQLSITTARLKPCSVPPTSADQTSIYIEPQAETPQPTLTATVRETLAAATNGRESK